MNTEKQPETTEDIVTSQQNKPVEQKNGVIQDSNGTLNGNEVLSSQTADGKWIGM